jgi:hypothetical protein
LLKIAEVERANNRKNNNKNKKNAFVFSDEEVEMLISEWGKREVLFDSKNHFYFNKDARATALNRMIEELKFPGLLARKFIMKFIYNYRFILWRRLS